MIMSVDQAQSVADALWLMDMLVFGYILGKIINHLLR